MSTTPIAVHRRPSGGVALAESLVALSNRQDLTSTTACALMAAMGGRRGFWGFVVQAMVPDSQLVQSHGANPERGA